MPTYDYECQKCGKVFEVFHGMNEAPKVKCEKKGCTGRAKKLIGAGSGLIFKGSGFYITDYKNGSSRGGSEASAESKTDSKSEAKSESKSESKTESKSEKKAAAKSETKSTAGAGSD